MVDGHPFAHCVTPTRDACSASNTFIARILKPRRHRCSNGYEHRTPRHPALPVLRRAPRAGDVDVPPVDLRSDSRRHPRMRLLHLSRRRRHSGAAPAADCDSGARAHRGRTSGPGASGDGRSRNRRRGRAIRGRRVLESSTYREIVEALGPNFEGGYFLYRFSDPTFIVANAVVRAVAGTVLGGSRRAVDICGGSGHLTRSLMDLSSPPPVLADLFFPKIWLGRRFTAPGCEPVCCDGNGPMPFARGSFGYAMCSDAFQYIWTKRLFVGEMSRLVDGPERGCRRDQPHAQPIRVEPVARPTALASRLRAICSRRLSP